MKLSKNGANFIKSFVDLYVKVFFLLYRFFIRTNIHIYIPHYVFHNKFITYPINLVNIIDIVEEIERAEILKNKSALLLNKFSKYKTVLFNFSELVVKTARLVYIF